MELFFLISGLQDLARSIANVVREDAIREDLLKRLFTSPKSQERSRVSGLMELCWHLFTAPGMHLWPMCLVSYAALASKVVLEW